MVLIMCCLLVLKRRSLELPTKPQESILPLAKETNDEAHVELDSISVVHTPNVGVTAAPLGDSGDDTGPVANAGVPAEITQTPVFMVCR